MDSPHSESDLRVYCLNLALAKFKQCEVPEITIEIADMFYRYIVNGKS